MFGVGSNYLLNLKSAAHDDLSPLSVTSGNSPLNPVYEIAGPRQAYIGGVSESVDGGEKSLKMFKVPIHIRRSTFRLPTNPKSPVLMIGPGTVSPSLLFSKFWKRC